MTENKGNEKKVTLEVDRKSGAQVNIAKENADGAIFDDTLRTIQERRSKLLIPVVNDAFGEHHPMDAEVTRLPEAFQKVVSKVVADGCSVIEKQVYHLEVQSRSDSTMAIRMVEYDFMIGLSMAEKDETGYTIRFPKSCVIYLRHNEGTPEEERVTVEFQDGQTVLYRVKALKVQKYTLDELFEKELYAYLPFYLMRYEKDLEQIEDDEERTKELLLECEEILSRLEEALKEEPEAFQDLLHLIRKTTDHLLRKREKLKGEVETVMGGKVLELPSDKLREAEETGRAEGSDFRLIQQIQRKLRKGKIAEEIAEDLEEPLESVRRICKAVEICGEEDVVEIYKFLKSNSTSEK